MDVVGVDLEIIEAEMTAMLHLGLHSAANSTVTLEMIALRHRPRII